MVGATELPASVQKRLKPSLQKLYSRLPTHISSRIAELVDKAQYFPVNPNRLVKYALLLVTSERELAGTEISRLIRNARAPSLPVSSMNLARVMKRTRKQGDIIDSGGGPSSGSTLR